MRTLFRFPRFSWTAVATAALALPCVAVAQATSPAAAPARGTTASGSDATIQLTEFTVSEKAFDGYVASESITGTRVATPIKDLPFAVSVITSEFMNDF